MYNDLILSRSLPPVALITSPQGVLRELAVQTIDMGRVEKHYKENLLERGSSRKYKH
jgi:hypothetical protein